MVKLLVLGPKIRYFPVKYLDIHIIVYIYASLVIVHVLSNEELVTTLNSLCCYNATFFAVMNIDF